MFFANPNFDLVWKESILNGGPYVDEDLYPYAQSPDITISDQVVVSSTPEPATFILFASLLPAGVVHFRGRRYARRSANIDRFSKLYSVAS